MPHDDQPYQLLPPLSGEEYAALREDIRVNGIRVPVDVDEQGRILDGHHRARVAQELGIECPTRVLTGLSEEDKREHAMALNMARRHLSQAQRRQLIADELARNPNRSDRAIARIIGVDHKTVGAVRRAAGGEIPHPETVTDALTEAESVMLDQAVATIDKVVDRVDLAVLFALSNRVDPMLIVGWLSAARHRVDRLDVPEDILRVMRRMVDERVRFVLDQGHQFAAEHGGSDLCFKPLTDEEVVGLARTISWGSV